VAERHLKAVITFRAIKKQEHIAAIRELAGGSSGDKAFVRRSFPALYREAFGAG
jgi:hypothetical protein